MRDDGEQDRHIVLKDTVPHSISPARALGGASRAVAFQPQLRLLLEEYDLLEDQALLVSSGIKKLSDLLHVDEDVIRNSQLTPVSKAKLNKLVAAQMQRVASATAANHPAAKQQPSLAAAITQRDICVRQQWAEGAQQNADKRSEPQEADKKRIKVDVGEAKYVLSVPACCSVEQACAFAESRMGSSKLGARRIRTFALPDGCELDADDPIVEVVSEMVKECEMLRAVFAQSLDDSSKSSTPWTQGLGGREGGDSVRVTLWDTRRNRLLAGNSSPMAKNIDKYLLEKPWMRVWKGEIEDREPFALSNEPFQYDRAASTQTSSAYFAAGLCFFLPAALIARARPARGFASSI
jgi:hypothetical protein